MSTTPRRSWPRFLPPTPLLRPAALAERLGFDVYVKCENLQPTGAFKVRGGLNLFNTMPAEIRERGVVTASTGNHGQSIAYAGREFGVRVRVFVPEGANPGKVAAIRRMGGEVVFAGLDFAGSCTAAEETADREGAYLIHPANEPALIAGVATYVLEILDAVPDLDVLFVPVGGGSGACGAVIAGKGTSAKLKVVAVQSLGAPAAFESWRRRELLDARPDGHVCGRDGNPGRIRPSGPNPLARIGRLSARVRFRIAPYHPDAVRNNRTTCGRCGGCCTRRGVRASGPISWAEGRRRHLRRKSDSGRSAPGNE